MSENTTKSKKLLKIEVEGTDGAGKTTFLKYLVSELKKQGKEVIETREVGNPNIPICLKLRELVLDPKSNLSGEAMEYVFSAMRIENDKWLKSLRNSENKPDFVVSDRGWLSHLAYTDNAVNQNFTSSLYGPLFFYTEMPDIVIYLSVDSKTALERRIKRGGSMDAIEMKGVEFQESVRQSFGFHIEEMRLHTNTKVYEVDANLSLKEVKKQADDIIKRILSNEQ